MNKHQEMVREFQQVMQPEMVGKEPRLCSPDIQQLRIDLIGEEYIEYADACFDDNLEGIADALADLLYVVYGAAVCHGIDMEPIFEEVHAANMRKIDGPKSATGKQLKPEGWVGPDIARLVQLQLNV